MVGSRPQQGSHDIFQSCLKLDPDSDRSKPGQDSSLRNNQCYLCVAYLFTKNEKKVPVCERNSPINLTRMDVVVLFAYLNSSNEVHYFNLL
jgi:hypothetical protein